MGIEKRVRVKSVKIFLYKWWIVRVVCYDTMSNEQ
jgi:hypothetical protein